MSLVARRRFLAAAGILFAPPLVRAAQQPTKPKRIGWIEVNGLDNPETRGAWDAFRLELQRRGWEEDRNVQFEQRVTKGDAALARQYALEMVEAKVDLVVTIPAVAAMTLKKATPSIPVVFMFLADPVGIGLVASLARPGGNVTGFSTAGSEIVGKRLELLKETFPHIVRVGYLPGNKKGSELSHRAAEKLGIQLITADSLKDGNFARAIAAVHADAWFVAPLAMNFANSNAIIEAIAKQRKPAMYPSSFFTALGGLMSYSENQRDQYRKAAAHVDRILRGAKPADLPVELPTVFEFAVNMKTAKAQGLTIPQSMLFRIDRIIN